MDQIEVERSDWSALEHSANPTDHYEIHTAVRQHL